MKAFLTHTRPTLAHKVPDSQDFITILMTAAGHTASKKFLQTPTGTERIDFSAGWLFNVMTWEVRNIQGLSEALVALEQSPTHLIIRGAPADPAYIGAWVQRKGSGDVGNFFTPRAGRHWVLIDFDKIQIPNDLSLKKDPIAVCEYLVGQLPAEFHNVSYHWQMSSSAGIGDPSKVSMHTWFWLDRPIPDSVLKAWGESVNDKAGFKLVDTALYQHVQAHYTAAPIFEGMVNPFPKRSGLEMKACDSVDLVLPVAAPQSARVRTAKTRAQSGNVSTGSGFEYHLSRIGDHPGGEGFHGPIVAAVASYVATRGEDGTDREALYQAVRERVLSADARNHDLAYIEHMASRKHIESAIDSALRKFGTVSRPKLHTDCAPHFPSDPISAAAATQRLEDLAKLVC